ncbi:MAG: hypothetical protein ACJ8HI_15955 [Massilia sp.]
MKSSAFLIALAACLMAACAGKPAEPAWRGDASAALDNFTSAYLEGKTGLAASDFARARLALSSTGRADLVAHAELVRCAAITASAGGGECAGFASLATQATPAQRSYAAYLAGRWREVDPALLPAQQQAAMKTGLSATTDSLSRLVAAGAMLQAGRLAPADIGIAIDTASSQGWRRPLLTWLGIAVQRARAAGDTAEVTRLEQRIALTGSL